MSIPLDDLRANFQDHFRDWSWLRKPEALSHLVGDLIEELLENRERIEKLEERLEDA